MRLRRLFFAVIDAVRWVRALEFVAKEQYELAWRQLLSMKNVSFLEAAPKFIQPLALYALVAHRLSHDSEAIRVIKLAADALKDSSSGNEIEREYLEAYLEMLRLMIEHRTFDECSDEVRALRERCDKIDIESVPRHLKLNFPLLEKVIKDTA